MKKKNIRNILLSFFVISISFWNYTNLSHKDCIRLIHEVSLLIMGFALGVFFVNLVMLFRKEEQKK